MSILVLAEVIDGSLSPTVRNAVTAAGELGGDLHVLVVGENPSAAAEAASKLAGVAKVLQADGNALAHGLAEDVAPLIAGLTGYTHIVVAATSFGKDVAPRASALLDVQQVSEVIRILSPDTYLHPIYAGNAWETVQSKDAVKLLTIRPTAFAAAGDGGKAPIESITVGNPSGLSRYIGAEMTKSERPELGGAKIVVSGGRGLGSKDNFQLLERIADKLGAALGASRAAVDAGYVPNDYQVGQTGKVVAPELYIAVGISGAIQHLAGMKDSKVIVAINKDENAPIFEIADYGLVADLFEALPKLEALL